MATTCYAMVRGSVIRVTGLTKYGTPGDPLIGAPDPIYYAVSKSVTKVAINEVTESASNEMLKTDEDENRLHFVRNAQVIRKTVDVDFLRVDPGVLSLVVGAPLALNAAGDIVGFDSNTKRPAASFALEVWSKLAGQRCADGTPQYGYTLFPYLKGGRLSGFAFQNGLVSFSLRAAQTRKAPRWGVGPYDLEDPWERLTSVVSRNSSFQNFLTPAVPPSEDCGVLETTDVLENGNAFDPMGEDFVDGGTSGLVEV